MSLADFISGSIGKPWSVKENCWTLTARIQRDYFGRELPLALLPRTDEERHSIIHTSPERARWKCVPQPEHGAVVLMSAKESPRVDKHAGVCVFFGGPIIVHVDDPHGVVADDIVTLRARGWFPTFWMPA